MSARIGYVSTFNQAEGTASVYYPDRTGEVTNPLPVFTPCGVSIHLNKGDMVLVSYLDNGAAVVMGTFAGNGMPAEGILAKGGSLTFRDSSGSISVADLLAIKAAHAGGV